MISPLLSGVLVLPPAPADGASVQRAHEPKVAQGDTVLRSQICRGIGSSEQHVLATTIHEAWLPLEIRQLDRGAAASAWTNRAGGRSSRVAMRGSYHFGALLRRRRALARPFVTQWRKFNSGRSSGSTGPAARVHPDAAGADFRPPSRVIDARRLRHRRTPGGSRRPMTAGHAGPMLDDLPLPYCRHPRASAATSMNGRRTLPATGHDRSISSLCVGPKMATALLTQMSTAQASHRQRRTDRLASVVASPTRARPSRADDDFLHRSAAPRSASRPVDDDRGASRASCGRIASTDARSRAGARLWHPEIARLQIDSCFALGTGFSVSIHSASHGKVRPGIVRNSGPATNGHQRRRPIDNAIGGPAAVAAF